MPGRPYVLNEVALRTLPKDACQVAVLPWGATEPHNLHLPYGTDSIQAEAIAIEAARLCHDRGLRIMVLPTVPFGANEQQLGTTLTVNMHPSTQAKVLEDIAESLDAHDIRKLVLINGHGGNDFKPMVREVQSRVRMFLCIVNWWTVLPGKEYFDDPGDHAGELETSVMLHIAPGWVLPLDQAGRGRARIFRIQALREGWAWAPRDWKKVTDDTGVGDPKAASAAKGERFFHDVTQKVAGFLSELAAADLDDMYRDP